MGNSPHLANGISLLTIAGHHEQKVAHEDNPASKLEKLAYEINEAARVSGLSRTTLYELMKAGRLKTVLVAGRRLVPAENLKALLNQDEA